MEIEQPLEKRGPGRPPKPRPVIDLDAVPPDQLKMVEDMWRHPGSLEIVHNGPVQAHVLLKELLLAVRVRSIIGYRTDGRCLACNHPHPVSKPCKCKHHEALRYLQSIGVEVEM
jgi:hypothetical protein